MIDSYDERVKSNPFFGQQECPFLFILLNQIRQFCSDFCKLKLVPINDAKMSIIIDVIHQMLTFDYYCQKSFVHTMAGLQWRHMILHFSCELVQF